MPNDPTRALMQRIFDTLHPQLAAAVASSSIPEEFLGALIAGESNGDPKAVRFEPAVFGRLALVLVGKKAEFAPAGIQHPLGKKDLLPYLAADGFTANLSILVDLATSFGLTQIMGWHAVEFSKTLWAIEDPAKHLDFTILLLAYFANKYQLDLRSEFSALFTCWNTGRPDGKTFDPAYVSNGLARMAVYAEILRGKP